MGGWRLRGVGPPLYIEARGGGRETGGVLGGPEIITFLLLALGGALAVGNIAALINPEGPRKRQAGRPGIPPPPGAPDEEARPKVGRSVVMIAVGLVIVVWAIASLIGG